MTVVWATRGREWGFRFLLKGGLSDPLPVYEDAFRTLQGAAEGCERSGDLTALRLVDPEGRVDRAGRPIAHDFVLLDDSAAGVVSVEDGLRIVWPRVADRYARVWDLPAAPDALG
ncbi:MULTISPECIES: hypothetical protein [unclassified Microbacterium]|uniref:hypothetical protein n=1 Tax=Microbacterium TaxID=33882 RepID=UPI003BA1F69F